MKKLIAAGLIVGSIGVAGCGGGRNVADDLSGLMDRHNVQYSGTPSCVHQSANQYVCKVTGTTDGTVYADVTDDGTNIYAQGL